METQNVKGHFHCEVCDDTLEVEVEFDQDPDVNAVRISGLHMHLGSEEVLLPDIYVTTTKPVGIIE